jgi:hypothetical protein
MGYLQGSPSPQAAPRAAKWDAPQSGTLDERARAYLDNNCAHCHQPGAGAGYTGFDLRLTSKGLDSLGVCKSPNSAGRVGGLIYDLVPGKPDESILLARMESTRPKEMMPQIGRSVIHQEGVALIREWIQSLPADPICARVRVHLDATVRRAVNFRDTVARRCWSWRNCWSWCNFCCCSNCCSANWN